jgi:hypothetical protein
MMPHRILSTALALAILAAPFIALLYGRQPGLIVLAGTLAATIGIGLSVRENIPPDRRQLLGVMLAVNTILLAVAIIGAVLVSL